jgi:isopenicillin-N N-acyltransferase-like protein
LEAAAGVEEAIELIGAAPRCASCNHMLADRAGDLADVEATPAGMAVLRTASGVLTHANHCLAPNLMACDSFARDKPDTVARGLRAAALVGDGPLDDAALQRALSDHATAPQVICRHAQQELPRQEQAATIASVIMDLTAGTMDVADGPPCSNNYHPIRLHDLLRTPATSL